MDFGKLIGESFSYTKDGLLGNIGTWVLLLILTILPIIPLVAVIGLLIFSMAAGSNFMLLIGGIGIAVIVMLILMSFYTGYQLKILRGETPLPPVADFPKLFSDGIRYVIIQVIYAIPALIVFCITVLPAVIAMIPLALAGETTAEPDLGLIMGMLGGILLTVIVAFIIGLISMIGGVRFARTGSFGEAFNFSAIFATINKIGWGTYIIALIIMGILVGAVTIILGIIPFVGGILQFILGPAISIFTMRYICLLYDSAGTA